MAHPRRLPCSPRGILLGVPAALAFLVPVLARGAPAQDPKTFFRRNCTNCHTIGGGRLVGPDLKDVTKRQKREWLVSYITDPNAKLDSNDPYAMKLLREARGQRMTPIAGMTAALARALLDLIEAQSALPRSEFMGLQLPERDFVPQDVADGQAIFLGRRRLENGGAPCVSCHTVGGLGGLSGGRLAPDLTRVFERLEGRKALAQWLSAPPTEQMKATFQDHPLEAEEIFPIVAFLQDATIHRQEDASPSALIFSLAGLGGAALVLAILEWIWRGRFRGVRRPQVHGQPGGEPS